MCFVGRLVEQAGFTYRRSEALFVELFRAERVPKIHLEYGGAGKNLDTCGGKLAES